MTKTQAIEICRSKFGRNCILEVKHWKLPEAKRYVEMCYASVNGVIKAVGKDWEDLTK